MEYKVTATAEELQKVRKELEDLQMSHKDFEDSVRVSALSIGRLVFSLIKLPGCEGLRNERSNDATKEARWR